MNYHIVTELSEHNHFSILRLDNYFILTSIYRKHHDNNINDNLDQKKYQEKIVFLELLRFFTLLLFPPPIIILPASGDHNIYLRQILLLYSCSTGHFWLVQQLWEGKLNWKCVFCRNQNALAVIDRGSHRCNEKMNFWYTPMSGQFYSNVIKINITTTNNSIYKLWKPISISTDFWGIHTVHFDESEN